MRWTFASTWTPLAIGAILCAASWHEAAAQHASASDANVTLRTGDVTSDDPAPDAGPTPSPVTIVAARNGTFSGKVVVESAEAVRGVRASVGRLSCQGKALPADAVKVRYGVAWEWRVPSLLELNGWQRRSWPKDQDILLESPPAEVARTRWAPARVAVWVTVDVPREAEVGTYAGVLTVEADGLPATKVPVRLDVQDWALPDSQDFRTWTDIYQSPDTLAAEYDVPRWSPKHWELVARSLRLIRGTGSRVVYVPLLSGTNFGNAESMVRWIRKGDDRYEYDFTVLDRYLDAVEKNLGKPKRVVFIAWDIYLCPRPVYVNSEVAGQARTELRGKGPRVTVVDPGSGKTDVVYLPRYEDAASKVLWQPLWDAVRQRMARRGLDPAMMLGVLSDTWPTREEVAFLKDVAGDLPWASHSHLNCLQGRLATGNKVLHNLADVGYAASVYNLSFQANPDKGRDHGWQHPELIAGFPRHGIMNGHCIAVRTLPALNITGGQRGLGRLGADFWPAVTDKRGRRVGYVSGLYPENSARNLDLESYLLAPGPDGPVATARLENLREGIQECEARIAIEDALLDADKRAALGDDLAGRCQALLDERQRALWKSLGVSDKDIAGQGKVTGKIPIEALWNAIAQVEGLKSHDYMLSKVYERMNAEKGHQWWLTSGWQDRNKGLFALAGEVAARLAKR